MGALPDVEAARREGRGRDAIFDVLQKWFVHGCASPVASGRASLDDDDCGGSVPLSGALAALDGRDGPRVRARAARSAVDVSATSPFRDFQDDIAPEFDDAGTVWPAISVSTWRIDVAAPMRDGGKAPPGCPAPAEGPAGYM